MAEREYGRIGQNAMAELFMRNFFLNCEGTEA